MQVILMRLMSKGEYLIVPKGTKFTGAGKLGLNQKGPVKLSLHEHILNCPQCCAIKQTGHEKWLMFKERRTTSTSHIRNMKKSLNQKVYC